MSHDGIAGSSVQLIEENFLKLSTDRLLVLIDRRLKISCKKILFLCAFDRIARFVSVQ